MFTVLKKRYFLAGLSCLPLLSGCQGEGNTQNVIAADDPILEQLAILDSDPGQLPREVASLSTEQRNGYLGRMSERVILSGNLDLMNSQNSYVDALDDLQSLKEHIKLWHSVAIDSVALDHTPDPDIENYSPSQGGPTRTSRALAMIQISVFDALNSIDREYQSYIGIFDGYQNASRHAAVAYAAYNELSALYPQQRQRLNSVLSEVINTIEGFTSDEEIQLSQQLGSTVANSMRVDRMTDGSDHDEPNFGDGGEVADGIFTYTGTVVNGGTTREGEWAPDPNTPQFAGDFNLSLGAYWGDVEPFILQSGDQFRVPAPPTLNSQEYIDAYNEVAAIGGASDNTGVPSTSTDDTRFIANYWGYDGVPLIGVPPRVYNQISVQLADDELDDPLAFARVLALVNIGMADAAIAAWDSKYYYNLWRPVMGIRAADDLDATLEDPNWNPVGVSVINTEEAIRATPPFPAYPSGHSTFGGVTFGVLRQVFNDNTPFTFVSDEYNGEGVDPFFPDVPRPFVPVRFQSLTEAQQQNGISRVYNGVHWEFDDTAGQNLGEDIAQYLINGAGALSPGFNGNQNNPGIVDNQDGGDQNDQPNNDNGGGNNGGNGGGNNGGNGGGNNGGNGGGNGQGGGAGG